MKGSVQILVAVLLRVYPGNFAFDTLSSRLDGVAAWVCCLNVRMKLPLLKIRWPQYQIDERASISISKEGCSPWLPRGQPLCAIIMPSPGRSLAPQVILGRGRLLHSAGCDLRVWSQQRRIVGLGIRGRSDRLERNVVREAGLLNGGVVGKGPQTKGDQYLAFIWLHRDRPPPRLSAKCLQRLCQSDSQGYLTAKGI